MEVMKALGVVPEVPAGMLELGNPALLRMGMGEAAAYFGVAAPIAKRDRKSGARKRKQHEIEALRLAAAG
jgi:DNA (cytosine-5)-methyltransferase 1